MITMPHRLAQQPNEKPSAGTYLGAKTIAFLVFVATTLTACSLGHHQLKVPPTYPVDQECTSHNDTFVLQGDRLLVNKRYEKSSLISNICVDDQMKSGAKAAKMSVAVIEFDDDGNHWDRTQMLQAIDAIRDATERVFLVVYVHGWLANAEERGASLSRFRWFVSKIATSNVMCTELGESSCPSRPHVFGVYIAWRGNPLEPIPGAGLLTFWNRRSAARRIAGTAMTETLHGLFNALEAGDIGRYGGGEVFRSRSLVMGHSMGAHILKKAFAQSFLGIRSKARRHYTTLFRDSLGAVEQQVDIGKSIDRELGKSIRRKKKTKERLTELETEFEATTEAIDDNSEELRKLVNHDDVGTLRMYKHLWIPALYGDRACNVYDAERVESCIDETQDARIVARCIARELACVYRTHQCAANRALATRSGAPKTGCNMGDLDIGAAFELRDDDDANDLGGFLPRVDEGRSQLAALLASLPLEPSATASVANGRGSTDRLLRESSRTIVEDWLRATWQIASEGLGKLAAKWSERLNEAVGGANDHVHKLMREHEKYLDEIVKTRERQQAAEGAQQLLGGEDQAMEDLGSDIFLRIPRVTEDEVRGVISRRGVEEQSSDDLGIYSNARVDECIDASNDLRISTRCIAKEFRRTLIGYQCSVAKLVFNVDVAVEGGDCTGLIAPQEGEQDRENPEWAKDFLAGVSAALSELDDIVIKWPAVRPNTTVRKMSSADICGDGALGGGRIEMDELSKWLERIDLLDERSFLSWLPNWVRTPPIPNRIKGVVQADLQRIRSDLGQRKQIGKDFLCKVADAIGRQDHRKDLEEKALNLKRASDRLDEEVDRVMSEARRLGDVIRSHRAEKKEVDREIHDLVHQVPFQLDGALYPPGDLVVLLNAATEAMSTRSLMQAMCLTKGETEQIFKEIEEKVPLNVPTGRPWIVSLTSESDWATRFLFPLGVRVGRLFRRDASRDFVMDDGAEKCEYHVGTYRDLVVKTAGHLPEMRSHEVRCFGTDDPRRIDAGDDVLFSFEVESPAPNMKCDVRELEAARAIGHDYWVAQVPNEIIDGHRQVLNGPMLDLVMALLEYNETFAPFCAEYDKERGCVPPHQTVSP